MRRTDLVVPARLVEGLQIPPLAVTTGEPDPEWVEVPMSAWRFRRRPVQRLPLDARSARRARRYIRVAPWWVLGSLVRLLALVAVVHGDLAGRAAVIAFIAAGVPPIVLDLARVGGELPRQAPYRTGSGDLRIPKVPVTVARQWVEQNPGVTATDEPAPRPHSRRFYATWSVALAAAAVWLSVVLANDGREDLMLIWMMVPVLFFTGVYLASKLLPPGYLRFEDPDHG